MVDEKSPQRSKSLKQWLKTLVSTTEPYNFSAF